MLKIESVTTEGQGLEVIRSLFLDYQRELGEDLCFQSFDAELKDPLQKYGAPMGVILLAYWNDEPAGCIALYNLGDGIGEMKRLYVKPEVRKHHIGLALTKALLARAAELRYQVMKLDTLQRLTPAIRLYQQLGFITTTAYYQNPIGGVVYMEKQL